MTEIEKIKAAIATLSESRAELLGKLADSRSRRAIHGKDVLLSAATEKQWAAAVADEARAMALLADAEALGGQLKHELSAAEAAADSAVRANWKSGFDARLRAVMAERGIVEDRNFDARAVKQAYAWLATMRRTAAADRTRYVSHWLDQMANDRHGHANVRELVVAAYMHGDIIIEDTGKPGCVYFGISDHAGRDAQSVPLTGDPTPPRPTLDEAGAPQAAPVHITLHPDWTRGDAA